jgi:hypothetical protein
LQARRLAVALLIATAGLAGVALASCGRFDASDPSPVVDEASAPSEASSDASSVPDAPAPDAADPADAATGLIAFVTSVGYADVVSAVTADTKCVAEADGRLPGKFVAWFSTPSVPAPARLVNAKGAPLDGPWFRVDGRRIAASRSALVSAVQTPLENAITLTATGKTMGGGVWTGTRADGGTGILCPLPTPTTGSAGDVGVAWTEQSYFTAHCGDSLAVYCFQVQ